MGEGRVFWGEPGSEEASSGSSQLLVAETYYDAEFCALRVVTVSASLFPSSSSSSGEASVSSSDPAGDEAWAQLGSSPLADAAALTLLDAAGARRLEGRLDRFYRLMEATFSAATLARHAPLVQRSVGFFCKSAWQLCNEEAGEMAANNAALCAARHISRVALVAAVENVVMDRLYTVVMPLLCVMHADHDATLSMAASLRGSFSGGPFGVPPEMQGCLGDATLALDMIARHTTPLGKLRCVQNCVAAIARQARMAKEGPAAAQQQQTGASAPERPLSMTADELLPLLISVILQCSVPNLSAHFSYIQFRQDKGSELEYYLTTVRAALEYIRSSTVEMAAAEDSMGLAEGASASSSINGSFGFELMEGNSNSSSSKSSRSRLSPHLLAESMSVGRDALEVKDRWFRLNRYRNCWVAAEFVDWIVQHHQLSRDQAIMLGRSMAMQGLVRHVSSPEREFCDDYEFFVWTDQVRPPSSSPSSLNESVAAVVENDRESSAVLSQVRKEVNQRRGKSESGWTAAKQLVFDMSDPVMGVEVADTVSETFFSKHRCFSLHDGLAWLRRSKHMTASEASEAVAALVELGLVSNLTPSRSEPAQTFLQFAALPGHPTMGPPLVDLVLTADVPLTLKTFLFSECWCFSGALLLDWLVQKRRSKTRNEARVLARRLQNAGLLGRVGRDGLFVDSSSTFFVWKLEGLVAASVAK